MSQKKKPTTTSTTAAPAQQKHTSTKPRQTPYSRQIQTFVLVWLDANIDEVNNEACINTISKLRETVQNVYAFTTVDECIKFITNVKEGTIFMISSGIFAQTAVPIVHGMAQVSTIYIFCGDKVPYQQWIKQWSKVKGIFTAIRPIREALKQATFDCPLR